MFMCSYYASLCSFSQQPSEGDNGGHAGAVQEQERGQTLQAERICEIRQEVRSLPLHIQNQSTKNPDKKHQTPLWAAEKLENWLKRNSVPHV